MYNCIKGLYLGDNLLKTDDGFIFLSFYGIMNDKQYINKTIFVRGEFQGSTYLVKEVIET